MDHKNSFSASYAAAGVDITAGYKSVELMKKHVTKAVWMMLAVSEAVSISVRSLEWNIQFLFPVQTAAVQK